MRNNPQSLPVDKQHSTQQAVTCDTLGALIGRVRDLVSEDQAAEIIQVKKGTLAVWRSTGRYNIPFIKIGSKVRYRLADLEAWLMTRTRANGATA